MKIYRELHSCGNLANLEKKLTKVIKHLGFDSFFVFSLKPRKSGLITNMDKRIFSGYLDEEYLSTDIINEHLLVSKKVVYQDEVKSYLTSSKFSNTFFKRNLKALNILEKNGMANSISFGEPCYLDRIARLTFGSSMEDSEKFKGLTKKVMPNLSYICEMVATLIYCDFMETFKDSEYNGSAYLEKDNPLSPKERKLAKCMVEKDLTLKQASSAVHISLDTGNKHMASIRRKMGVDNKYTLFYLMGLKNLL